MKLLSIVIPCFNSQEYMRHAIESALVCGDDIELLLVDDGSTDDTFSIAKEYESKHPDIVHAIHKENGGHGSAVNTGLKHASGLYFKVLDSDDWFDTPALERVIEFLRYIVTNSHQLDLLITNYVYEKPSKNKQKVIRYNSALPANMFFTWNDVRHFRFSQNLLMHSVIYKTNVLRECQLELPEHTFYVDNIFVYTPLPYVKSMYYLDLDLYRYFIGRDDQSVNEKIMIQRIDQQIKVTKIMIDSVNLNSLRFTRLRKYMIKYLAMMMIVSSVLLIKEGTTESLKKRDDLWKYLKLKNKSVYRIISRKNFGGPVRYKNKVSRKFVIWTYQVASRIYNFN